MQTIVTEIEALVNDHRPLTYVRNDLDDPSPLTPSQLIYGYRLTDLPISTESLEDGFGERILLTDRQKRCEKLRQQYWRCWSNEYLLSLRQRHGSGCSLKGQLPSINVGDVVISY